MTSKSTISLFIMLFALCNLSLFGQNPTPLALKVEQAKQSQTVFQNASLFENAVSLSNYEKNQSVLAEGTLLNLKSSDLQTVFSTKPEALQLMLPRHGKSPLVIDLVENKPLTDAFRVVTQSSNGAEVDYTPGLYYHGTVNGSSKSVVAISIFEEEIMGIVTTAEDGNMVLGKIGQSKGQYVFYETADLLVNNDFACGTPDEDLGISPSDLKKMQDIANSNAEKNLDNCVQVYVECEHDMFLEKGSVQNTVDHMTGLFNVVATLYNNEEITTQISEIFVWDTPDSYPTGSTVDALVAFRNARINSINGDLGHLVSRGAPASGGVAWVDALCSTYNFAYSWIQSSYNEFPTYSWSVEVFTHEMGHNLGSPHTHACAWNGNNTAIDGCGPASNNSEGCDADLPESGTIMSYCHLVNGVGIDFNLGFGPQPGDLIRNEIINASCLSTCGPPCEMTLTVTGTDANGGDNGTATATPSGGVSPYTYAWSNGGTTATITGLAPGNYSVTVNDSESCVRIGSITINDITPCTDNELTLTIVLDNYPEETTWDVKDSGGNTVASSNGNYGSEPDGSTVVETMCLPDGCYDFTIYDSFGDGICCAYGIGNYSLTDSGGNVLASGGEFGSSETTNFCLNDNPPPSISVSITNSANVSCAGGSDGSATALATGGSGNYSYAWSNNASGATASGLSAGNYTVTATDTDNNATATATVTITQPSQVNVSLSSTNASFGNADGTATASASGGTGSYSYNWSNNGNTATITGLAPGTYLVTVTDANNCSATGSVEVGEDSPTLSVTITNSSDVSCAGGSDGSATALATGGSGNYSYAWSNNASGATASSLSAGTYTVTATDNNNNATATTTVTISQPSQVNVTVTGTNASNGNADGTATASASGGTGSYSYSWSNNETTATITGLAPGTYSVVVSDANSCSTTGSVVIGEDPAGCDYTILDSEDFEAGWGIWNDGGSDAARINNSTYATSGTFSARVRDNTSTSVITTDNINALGYTELKVDFSYVAVSMDNANEDFWLQISTNGGASYTTVEEWNRGDEFENNIGESDSVTIPGPFSSNTRIRFRCDASGNSDWVYIDDVVISACGDGPPPPANYTLTVNVVGQGSVSPSGGTFQEGTSVTLNASAAAGWSFSNWSGDASGSNSSVTIVMNSDKTVTATFSENPPPGDCTEVTVDSNDFESGWGIWNDGGSDCRRSSQDAAYANGTFCARLRDNTSTSVMTTDNLNLALFEELTVAFSYYPRSMDNSNEDFWLQISIDGGATYTTLEEWNLNDEFVNNVRYNDSVIIPGPFTSTTRLRFRCDASGNSDWVYIDDVVITGCTTGSGMIAPEDDEKDEVTEEEDEPTITSFEVVSNLKLFPNPATDQLNVVHKVPTETEEAQLVVMDFSGKILRQIEVATGKNTTQVDLSQLNPGYYLLQLIAGEERIVKRFIIAR